MNHEVSGRTLLRVTVAHVIVIALTLLPLGAIFHFKKKDDTKFIEMVTFGTQNPAKGVPGPAPAAAKATASKPATQPAPALPAPPAAPPSPPAKVEEPPPKQEAVPELKKMIKSEPTPWDNPVPAPKAKKKEVNISTKVVEKNAQKSEERSESKIKVNTKVITRKVPWNDNGGDVGKKSEKTTAGKIYGKVYEGPSEGEIQSELKKGLQNVGVSNGSESGHGMLGRPDGQASWYHTLIRETFLKHWQKPQLPGAAKLETLVSIRIAPDGGVTFLGVSQSSGNAAMDESVRKAASAVTKLSQPLPSGLGHPDYEVTVNFRLD